MRSNALPYPVYGVPWTVVFPMLDADGDLVTGATTPDAEVSKNGDTFADCTNESTEIATASGVYYLTLTGTEMTADIVSVIAKSATAGMKTTTITLYPRKLVTLASGTVGANAADGTTIQLAAGAVAIDDYYNGCLIVGTLDSNVEARLIGDFVGSTLVCTVVGGNFVTTPDNNDTYVVYLPEGRQVGQDTVVGWVATAIPGVDTAGYPKVTIKDGTGTGEIDTNAGAVVSVTTTGTATAVTTVNGLAAGVITAASIATGAIDADALASDAVDEIWAKAMSDLAAVPAANASVLAAINWMFELARNKLTQTATTGTIFKDDASTSFSTTTVSDDLTTFTRGEWA
jgi:hypothetical protein